jgi:hypothetical protein
MVLEVGRQYDRIAGRKDNEIRVTQRSALLSVEGQVVMRNYAAQSLLPSTVFPAAARNAVPQFYE